MSMRELHFPLTAATRQLHCVLAWLGLQTAYADVALNGWPGNGILYRKVFIEWFKLLQCS